MKAAGLGYRAVMKTAAILLVALVLCGCIPLMRSGPEMEPGAKPDGEGFQWLPDQHHGCWCYDPANETTTRLMI